MMKATARAAYVASGAAMSAAANISAIPAVPSTTLRQ